MSRVIARTDRLLLANAIMGQFLTGVATRIFIVALPTLAGALHTDIIAISWALIVYQLAGISLSVVFGRLGDIHGRYTIYGTGFAIMTVSFVLCGFAPNAFLLIVFRLIQGLGAAMIASATRVLAMEAVPEGAEGRANSYMTMGFHSGLLVGPPLGGFIIDLFDWRWIFFPHGADGAGRGRPDGAARERPARPAPAGRAPSIDYLGAALLIALTVLLTLLLDRRSVETLGAERASVVALVFGGILVGFIAHERRAASPVVNLALFRIRMFTFSVLSLLLIATTISVMSFLMPFYIQDVLGFSRRSWG
jgi:MFS family permease